MNACPLEVPAWLNDIPEPDAAYYESISGGFDDSLNYEPVIIEHATGKSDTVSDLPPATVKTDTVSDLPPAKNQKPHSAVFTPDTSHTPPAKYFDRNSDQRPAKNQHVFRLDAFDILARAIPDIAIISEKFGIDASLLVGTLNRYETEYKNDKKTAIASDKDYVGKSKAWFDIKTTKSGQEYPKLTFHTFKDGDITEVFDGYEWLKNNGLVNAKPLNDTEKKALEAKRITRDQQQAKKAELAAKKQAYQNTSKTSRFNQFTATFNKLPALNSLEFLNCYLATKGFKFEQLPANFVIKRGYDSRGGYIVYALKNSSFQIVGYQKIYDKPFIDDNGNTRDKDFIFLPSAKNGSYATLSKTGKIKKGEKFYIAEGLATALTVFIASGQPVAIALDAGNLIHVATALNVYFKNVTFAADNDITPNSDKNTGIDKAKEAAKVVKGSVVFPDMNGVKCDFNDLMINQGIEAVRKVLNSEHNYQYVNTRYLDIKFRDGVNIIKSTYGTGKTYAVSQYIKKHPELSILYIAHLITLCSQAAERLGLDNYRENKILNDKEQLAICINSVFKLLKKDILPVYDVIVLDEIEQLLTRLTNTGKDEIKYKPIIVGVLKKLIATAKAVIALDADISEISINFLKSCRPDEQFNFVINEFNHAKTLYIYENRADIIKLAKKHTANNEPVLFATNSIGESEYIFEQINCTNKRLINSRTSNLSENIKFLLNVNVECKSDILTVISPSLSTGFSIESGHYQHNLGIFSHRVNTPLDCLQQLERDRLTLEKHVYISDAVTDWQPAKPAHGHEYNMMVIDNYGSLVCADPAYSELVDNVNKRNKKLMSRFKEEFIRSAKEKGYTVVIVQDTATQPEIMQDKAEKTAIKEAKEVERAEALVNTESLTPEKYQELKPLQNLPAEEKLQIERYEIEEFYKPTIEKSVTEKQAAFPDKPLEEIKKEVLKEVIIQDDKGARRDKIKNLKLAVMEWHEVKRLQVKKAEKRFIEDIDYVLPKHLLLSQLFKAIGINQDLTLSKDFYTADDLTDFIEWADEERDLISSFWSTMPSKETILENPYRYVRTLLDTVGLTQNRIVKKVDKKAACIGYKIDSESLERLHFFLLNTQNYKNVTEYKKAA